MVTEDDHDQSDENGTQLLGDAIKEPSDLYNATRTERIYALIRRIPAGRVTTYGQIAYLEGTATARMVGAALRDLGIKQESVPWQRVINSAGKISKRGDGQMAENKQRVLLEEEGVEFSDAGKVDFREFGWDGPDTDWSDEHGFHRMTR